MKILITGGSGFLGSHIADEASARGHDVRILDCMKSPWLKDNQTGIICDIMNAEMVFEAAVGCDVIFHCAAIADLQSARENPRKALEINVLGTLSVMEAASRANVGRFLHASSVYVYSRVGSIYRITKQASESLASDLSDDLHLNTTILRYGSLYGPRADADNAILRLTTQAVTQGRIDFWGDGSEIREYIHIRDAASLSLDAMDNEFIGQALLIAGRERLSTREMIETICETLGGGIDVSYQDLPFEGRYRLTPYSHDSALGRRLVANTYIDLGLGLLEQVQLASQLRDI